MYIGWSPHQTWIVFTGSSFGVLSYGGFEYISDDKQETEATSNVEGTHIMANNTELKTVTEYVRAGKSYSIVVDEATDQLYKVTPAGRKFKVDVDGAYDAVAGDGDALVKLQAYFAVDTDDAVKADDAKVDDTVVETEQNDDKVEADKAGDVKNEDTMLTDATDDAVVADEADADVKDVEPSDEPEPVVDEQPAVDDASDAVVDVPEPTTDTDVTTDDGGDVDVMPSDDVVTEPAEQPVETVEDQPADDVSDTDTADVDLTDAVVEAASDDVTNPTNVPDMTDAVVDVASHDVVNVVDTPDVAPVDYGNVPEGYVQEPLDEVESAGTEPIGTDAVAPKPIDADKPANVMSEQVSHVPVVVILCLIAILVVVLFMLFYF